MGSSWPNRLIFYGLASRIQYVVEKKSDELNLLSLLGDRKKKRGGVACGRPKRKNPGPAQKAIMSPRDRLRTRDCAGTGVVVQHASKWTASAASSGSSVAHGTTEGRYFLCPKKLPLYYSYMLKQYLYL